MYKSSWEIISNITSFRYSKISREEAKKHRENYKINDYINIAGFDSFVYFQAWHTRSKEPINILTNHAIFLLNDEGKTIEKIN